MNDLYTHTHTHHCKTSVKEIEEGTINGKIFSVHGLKN